MTIDIFLLCYNESRMIRHVLRYYSTVSLNITVLDNFSTDDTIGIIQREFPHVKIEQFNTDGVFNDKVHLDIKNNCWKNSEADWVIVADMDELLYHPNLLRSLQIRKEKKEILPVVEAYNMFSQTFPDNYNQFITDQVKTGVRAQHFDKQIIFQPGYVEEMNYSPGAHDCKPIITIISEVIKYPLYLLHYRFLGKEYVKERNRGYAARMSNYNKKNGFGAEYAKGDGFVDECFGLVESGKMPLQKILP